MAYMCFCVLRRWLYPTLTPCVCCACARICCDWSAHAASMADCVCELLQVPMQRMTAPCVRVLCLCVHMAFSVHGCCPCVCNLCQRCTCTRVW